MPITIDNLRSDMAKLAAELGTLAACPLPPFTVADQAKLASFAGWAVQAITHLAVVDAGGGPKTSTQTDMSKCDSDSTLITTRLQQVISQPPATAYTGPVLFNQASSAINDAYAIA